MARLSLIVIAFLSAGCSTGYTKSNGKWTYIVVNEGVGREVREIDADVATFKVHPNPAYASDKNHVYKSGFVLEGFDGATYRQFPDSDFAIDANAVYWQDSILPDANRDSFRVLGGPYGRDDQHIYCGSLRMNVENPEQFKVLSTSAPSGMVHVSFHYSTKDLVSEFGDEFADREVKYDPEKKDDRFRIATSDGATATDGTWLFTGPKRTRKAK